MFTAENCTIVAVVIQPHEFKLFILFGVVQIRRTGAKPWRLFRPDGMTTDI